MGDVQSFALGGSRSVDGVDGEEKEQFRNSQPEGTRVSLSQLPVELTSKYEVLNKIGSGSFGSVFKVRNAKTRVMYAAKHVEVKDNTATEVEIQAKIDDPHVVKIYDTILIPSTRRMVIVMEFCEGGNLLEWIKRNRRHNLLNEPIIMKMFQEICEAVYSCHQMKIIHRDLKPENVLLDNRRRVKLGTPPYMAPELFISYLARGGQSQGNIGYDGKCDVWSIGCILWDMANTANLFIFQLSNNPGLNVAQASESVGVKEIQELIDRDIPSNYVLTKRLLQRMLVNDTDQRISLSEILQDRELEELLENPMSGHWSDVM